MTIAVQRAGETSLRAVAKSGAESEEEVALELAIKAWPQGGGLLAEITPKAVTGVARREPGRTVK